MISPTAGPGVDAGGNLPSEDEWYKAAYYKGGGTDAGYWDYATQSDTAPTAELPAGADMTNGSANFYDEIEGGYVDNTYYTGEVGAYTAKPSDSAYDTFDQGGNVWEWNETPNPYIVAYRGLRGGSFDGYNAFGAGGVDSLHASDWNGYYPTIESHSIGFRVSSVPEPCSLVLLSLGGLMLRRRRRVR